MVEMKKGSEWSEVDEMTFRNIEQYGLDVDSINEWWSLDGAVMFRDMGKLHPLRNYAERLQAEAVRFQIDDKERYVKEVIKRSGLEKMRAYDELIDEYNAAIPTIVANKDFDAVKMFLSRASALIYGEK